MAPIKRRGGKNGGSYILCLPRSREFQHGPLRYTRSCARQGQGIFGMTHYGMPVYFSSPFVFPYLMYAMYVVAVIFFCHIKLYTYCAPCFNTRLLLSKGLCECLYIFRGFHFHRANCNGYGHLFLLPNMC